MRKRTRVIGIVGIVALGGTATSMTHVRHDIRICKICGASEESDSCTWTSTSTKITERELTHWLQAHGGHEHEWKWVAGQDWSVFGRLIEDGTWPAMGDAHPQLMDRFVTGAGDEKVASFVKVIQSGTEAEKKKVVQGAMDWAMEEMQK